MTILLSAPVALAMGVQAYNGGHGDPRDPTNPRRGFAQDGGASRQIPPLKAGHNPRLTPSSSQGKIPLLRHEYSEDGRFRWIEKYNYLTEEWEFLYVDRVTPGKMIYPDDSYLSGNDELLQFEGDGMGQGNGGLAPTEDTIYRPRN